MNNALYIGLLLPLIGFLTLTASAKRIGRQAAGVIGTATVLCSFIIFATLLWGYEHPISATLYQWIDLPSIKAEFNLYLDPLSLTMALIITGVGFLIHLYSIGYMDHEEDYARYFACMNLFIFAMLLLVLAGNLLLLFVGWEGVGLASYLLIGFWFQRPAAAKAATKAFVVNRIGDLGFLLALLLTYHLFGTSDVEEMSRLAAQQFAVGAPVITVLTLLYFVGATGKSAQIPLHVWLPDAMEGPTPVSALIHAATMVTAGVYLVVRMHDIFMLAPLTLIVIGVIGGATALFAALCAVGQTDLKRVLAYSTVSQLGLMFLACGVGAFYAAMFHLTTHAFVKALLFLSAGNVVHMMHGTTDMEKMGGLSKIFKKTHWLFFIGVLALSGIPPLSAFFSKELILEQEYDAGFKVLFYVGLVASILTAFYLTRAYCLTFIGQNYTDSKTLAETQEAPRVMLAPVSVLAVLAILGGFIGFSIEKTPPLEKFLEEVDISLPHGESTLKYLLNGETLLAVCGAILGVAVAYVLYTKYRNRTGGPIRVLKHSFYVDQIYQVVLVNPLKKLSLLITEFFEPRVFEGSIDLSTRAAQATAREMQKMQSGQIRSYVAWMAIGIALLVVYFVS